MTDTTRVPRDFVYTGQRYGSDGKRYVSIAVIVDGTLEKERWFPYKRDYDRSVGGVYTGAEFTADTAWGLSQARYKEQYPDVAKRIEWQARHDEANKMFKLAKLEADSSRVSDLERILFDARKLYASYRKRNDYGSMEALEAAVLRALKTPPRSTETD